MNNGVCMVPNCGEYVPEHQMMCQRCWRRVPSPLQRVITRLWNNGRPREGFGDACANAVDQVIEKRGLRMTREREESHGIW